MKTGRLLIALFALTALCAMLTVLSLPSWAADGNMKGTGSKDDPYQIEDYADLKAFAKKVNDNKESNACAILIKDIVANDEKWTPIGVYTEKKNNPYRGVFDGRLHTITGLYCDSSKNGIGLFGWVEGGTVQNTGLKNSTLIGNSYVGFIGNNRAGGVKNCYNTGSVSGNDHVGGIVGAIDNGGWIQNCYNTGSVSGDNYIGGITGGSYLKSSIQNCYNTGSVAGDEKVGGIVGNISASTVRNCFCLDTLLDTLNVSTIGYNNGTSTVENVSPLSADGFRNKNSFADWDDFDQNWLMTDTTPVLWDHTLHGSGTSDSPYVIATSEDWEILSHFVEDGGDTSGKYFRQTADITVQYSYMVGTEDHHFMGIYDGGGYTLTFNCTADGDDCAPFRYIRNATVKNLHTDGTINTSYKWAAGIVADAAETCKIINCRSSVTINALREGDGSHGGILAVTLKKYDNNVTIKGCVFDGKLLGEKTTKCGGLAGPVGGTLVLEDCLFLPSELTVDSDSSETLARADDLSVYYCWYYDKYFNKKQGTQATLVSPGENVILNLSGRTYDVSGLTVVGSGAEFGGRIYAKADVKLMFDISYDGSEADCVNAEYAATSGTLTKTNSGYEFRSSKNDAVINVAKTTPKLDYQSDLSAYVVKTAKDWNILSGYSKYYNTSNLKFVQTDDIIGVMSVIGNSGNHFRGSYDGGVHTLKVLITGGSDERCIAPFSYIEDAVIKNLRVEGSVNGYMHCAGLVGSITGNNNTIENVIVNAEITTTGTHCGGVIGHGGTSSTKLEGVVFTGKIEGGENVGTIWGWSDDKAEATLINCLEKGSYSVKGLNPVGLGNEPSSLKNVYHVSQEIGNPYRDWDGAGKRVFTVTADTGITVGFGTPSSSYSVSGITVYPAGIEYGGTFYVGEDDKITLSISGGSGIDGYTSTSGKLTKDGNKYVLTMPEDDVKIIGFRYGDVDGDGIRATLRDEILLVRYLSGWKSVQIIAAAADVDGDGKVAPKDAMILARHIAGWKGYEEIPYKP